MILGRFATLLVLTGLAAAVMAQAPAPRAPAPAPTTKTESGPTWATLPPAHQSALAPLQGYWASIDATRKSKWIEVAQRFPAMPAEERGRVQARMAEWATLSPTERGRARQNFQELRNLRADDRHALWEAYRALPDEQRRELAQRAKPPTRASEAASAPVVTVKRDVPVNPGQVTTKPVSPTVVQARPGATTTLLTKAPAPPTHNQPGLPKIAATDGFVNRSTLLPKRGPQGAATHAAAASAASADEQARP